MEEEIVDCPVAFFLEVNGVVGTHSVCEHTFKVAKSQLGSNGHIDDALFYGYFELNDGELVLTLGANI